MFSHQYDWIRMFLYKKNLYQSFLHLLVRYDPPMPEISNRCQKYA